MVNVAGPFARSCAETGGTSDMNKARTAAAIRIAQHYTLRYFVGTPARRADGSESVNKDAVMPAAQDLLCTTHPPLNRPGGRRMSERRDTRISRRDILRLSVGGGAGLAVGGLLDWPAAGGAAGNPKQSHNPEIT